MRREVGTSHGRRRWNASFGSRRDCRRHASPCWTAPPQTGKKLGALARSRCPPRSPRSSDSCRAHEAPRCGAAGAARRSPCPIAPGFPSGAPPAAVTARGSSAGPQTQGAPPSRSSIERWRSCGRSRRCRGSSSRRPSLSHRRLRMNGPAFLRNSPTGSTAVASTTGTSQPSGQPSLPWSKPSTVAGPEVGATRQPPSTKRGSGPWQKWPTGVRLAAVRPFAHSLGLLTP